MSVAPGGVNTGISLGGEPSARGYEALKKTLAANVRMAEADEIAAVIAFLASSDASFVNGEVLVADGGWTAAQVTATPATVERELMRQHFAVLSTTSPGGQPHGAGITYAATRESSEVVLYFMTRRHLRKARDIAVCPVVSLVVVVPRRVLSFAPPASLQLQGTAEIRDWTDARGTALFERFWLGRRVLAGYRRSFARGERRICFVRVVLDPGVRGYMVGSSLWDVGRDMRRGVVRVRVA